MIQVVRGFELTLIWSLREDEELAGTLGVGIGTELQKTLRQIVVRAEQGSDSRSWERMIVSCLRFMARQCHQNECSNKQRKNKKH